MLTGLNYRWALPDDVPLVAATWTESARAAWRAQPDCRIPFPDKALHVIQEARKREAQAVKHRDMTAAAHERSLLNAVFSREFARLVQAALLEIPPLVLYDEETPSLVIGWVHARPAKHVSCDSFLDEECSCGAQTTANWVYVKHKYRRLGHGLALLKAAGRPDRAAMMTKAGLELWAASQTFVMRLPDADYPEPQDVGHD